MMPQKRAPLAGITVIALEQAVSALSAHGCSPISAPGSSRSRTPKGEISLGTTMM
ncbi:putative alpha-methylacyl-CoA racemase [Mycobacterium xenopi 3993]|nr:putative alpha-methylacyl-CoA racemase [Mycobacterium xenopi 3993]